jgi:replicative DNA helicase
VFREEYYNPTDENKNKAELIIAKQRNGPVGSVDMAFIKEWTRFENPEFNRSEQDFS